MYPILVIKEPNKTLHLELKIFTHIVSLSSKVYLFVFILFSAIKTHLSKHSAHLFFSRHVYTLLGHPLEVLPYSFFPLNINIQDTAEY